MDEQSIDLQGSIRGLISITARMLEMELAEKDCEHLLCILEQRQLLIDEIKCFSSEEIKAVSDNFGLSEELLRLDSLLKQKFEAWYRKLREDFVVLQQRKSFINMYRKKNIFVEGLFLDNRK